MSLSKSYLQWRTYKFQKRLTRFLCSRFYQDNYPEIDRSILVAGTARSGTTWLGQIIASQMACRIMFEPFHSQLVPAFRPFHYFQYMRPAEANELLLAYCQTVFSGAIRHAWIDRQVDRLRPQYRLIKEIRANLFLKWIKDRFLEVPLLFIIRHPCAVVLSRLGLQWGTDSDIEPLLRQPKLVEDFLSDYMDVIEQADTDAKKHAIIWCISNLVPMTQFEAGALKIVYYEHLVTDPAAVLSDIFGYIGFDFEEKAITAVYKPSTTTNRQSAIVKGQNRLAHWQSHLSMQEIDDILNVVSSFGLDTLYDESLLPHITI